MQEVGPAGEDGDDARAGAARDRPGAGHLSTVKIGARKDGTLVAAQGTFYLQAGGLPGAPLRGPVGCASAAYAIPNVLSVGYDACSNRSKVAAFRAPGAPQGAHAAECVLDEIAEKPGIDPVDLRLKNSAKAGDKAIYGPAFGQVTFKQTVEAIKNHPHYTAPLDRNPRPGVKRGRGVASGFWYNDGGQSSVQVNIIEDANVVVTTGHPDVGGSRASIAKVVAGLLGIEHARVIFASAMVATASTEKVIGQLRERAAKIWRIDAEAVKWEDGMALPAGENADEFPPRSLKERAAKANAMGGPIGTQVQLNTIGAAPGFAPHCVDVEVDVDLGIVHVIRSTAAQDVGRALHPSYVEGQIQGGVVQGIGWALSEEYLFDSKGRVVNASFLDYRMPVCSDVPMIEPVMLEIPNPKHPQGVPGVGEAPIVPDRRRPVRTGGASCLAPRRAEQRERLARRPLQQRRLRPRPCQHAQAHHRGQQQTRRIGGIKSFGDGAVALSGTQAAAEEALQLAQPVAQEGADLGVVRADLEGGIDHEAAASVTARQREDLGHEGLDRVARRQAAFQPADALAHAAVEIAVEATDEQRALVAEGVVEARRAEAHRGAEVAHGGRRIAMVPELRGGGIERGVFVEDAGACHEMMRSTDMSYLMM